MKVKEMFLKHELNMYFFWLYLKYGEDLINRKEYKLLRCTRKLI